MADYWSSPASEEFYVNLSHRYETLFLAYHSGIVEETVAALEAAGGGFTELIEIGSGDGKILGHFARRMEGLAGLHGIDLNPEQTAANRGIYASDPRMNFHLGDAREWIPANIRPGTAVIANGGVLEYFTRPELQELFSEIGYRTPSVIAITESIAADHDLKRESDTFPYGLELSLSHNYLSLLHDAGYEIAYVNDRHTTPQESEIVGRWLQVVAFRK
ncbi:MAG: class I SAM-dependent methyltransferase [Akkermansiaceae bacterium]|nr:class I SAM-dependent methyltransferase [Akkermansiaceae bacterium]